MFFMWSHPLTFSYFHGTVLAGDVPERRNRVSLRRSPVTLSVLTMQIRLLGWILVLGCWMPMSLNAQTNVQLNFKTGVECWELRDERELNPAANYTGQMFGFDVFVESKRFVFAPGFHYRRINVSPAEQSFAYQFDDRNHIHYFAIPVTIGLKLIDYRLLTVSLMAGPEANFYFRLDPENRIDLDDDELRGIAGGLTGVFHVEWLSILTTEVKYHHALHVSFKNREESKFSGWTLAAGIKF